jgi:Flp pilus assembly protein TadG
MKLGPSLSPRTQVGAAAVEFAIVASVFFMILLGAIEMARLLWTWNAASEATRLGARLAVVCDINAPVIKTRMRQMLPALTNGNITINYLPGGCSALDCRSVTVTLNGYTHVPIIPLVPLSIPIPPFATSLPREFMQSAGNPICT